MAPPAEAPGTGLSTTGIFVLDAFLTRPRVSALRACAEARRDRGEFRDARMGAPGRLQRREEVRGDRTCWWDEPLFDAERGLCSDLEELRCTLNREFFLGLFDLELHYAWYPPGAGYARHVDQPRGRDLRVLSLILYLNEEWRPEDGGELRLFDGSDGHRDIEPVAGRLAGFLTVDREHAVLPTRAERLSVTGWFRRR